VLSRRLIPVQRGDKMARENEIGAALVLAARYLPEPMDRAARRWVYPAFVAARNRRIDLSLLKGEIRGRSATLLVAGRRPWAFDLPRRPFGHGADEIPLGEVALWKLPSVLEKRLADVDMVMARVDKLSTRVLFPAGYLRVPEWIDTVLTVPENLDALVRSNHSLRQDARLVRNHGFTSSISTSSRDFEEFYHSMYLPFVSSRYAASAWPTNEDSLRKIFGQGGIIWLAHEGERVSGLLFGISGDVLHIWAEGTRGGDFGVVKKGAVCALFLHAIRHAGERNCRHVHFGGAKACLSDGLLRYKRKWGVAVQARPENQFYTLVRWAAWNDKVASFLSDAPVLHLQGSGLIVVTAVERTGSATQADAERIYNAVHMPGVHRVVIAHGTDWGADVTPPPRTALVGGGPSPAHLVEA
jgi:hypothetical protein